MSGIVSNPDTLLVRALRAGTLTPAMVGVAQFEVRYFASDRPPARWRADDYCDLVSNFYDGGGRVGGSFFHCDLAYSDKPGSTIEGIGAEYLDGTTVSYITDDQELTARIEEVLRNA